MYDLDQIRDHWTFIKLEMREYMTFDKSQLQGRVFEDVDGTYFEVEEDATYAALTIKRLDHEFA